jgi:hypothetical protein
MRRLVGGTGRDGRGKGDGANIRFIATNPSRSEMSNRPARSAGALF